MTVVDSSITSYQPSPDSDVDYASSVSASPLRKSNKGRKTPIKASTKSTVKGWFARRKKALTTAMLLSLIPIGLGGIALAVVYGLRNGSSSPSNGDADSDGSVEQEQFNNNNNNNNGNENVGDADNTDNNGSNPERNTPPEPPSSVSVQPISTMPPPSNLPPTRIPTPFPIPPPTVRPTPQPSRRPTFRPTTSRPTRIPTVAPTLPIPIPLVVPVVDCGVSPTDGAGQCVRCAGHCDTDADCEGDLVCFVKFDRNVPIPGCIGLDGSFTRWCIPPVFVQDYIPPPLPEEEPPVVADPPAGDTLTTFCVIADVPYTIAEKDALEVQLRTLPDECEWVVHLGDLWNGTTACSLESFTNVEQVFALSPKPLFIVPGDNEWNDCSPGTQETAWDLWTTTFLRYDTSKPEWNHGLTVTQMPGRPENFYWVQKRTLFLIVNLVGGAVYPSEEVWMQRQVDIYNWVEGVMDATIPSQASGIVLMGHAKISPTQRHFFNRLQVYIRDVLNNEYPLLYIHGDGHAWEHRRWFYQQPSAVRIQTSGGTTDPVLVMHVDTEQNQDNPVAAFSYDRRL